MRFSLVKTCLVALTAVSSALAQATEGFDVFTQPSTPGSTIPAGQTYSIKWAPSTSSGKISIVLLQGSSNITLQMGPTIASGIDSTTGSYDWAVPSSGVSYSTYGLKIQLDSDNSIYQYSTYFSISGLSASASGTASTTVTVQVSQVSSAANSTTTVSASRVTILNSTTAAPSTTTAAGIFPNSTVTLLTTKTTTPATTTATAASSAASATKSGAAVSNAAIGGTGLLGAVFFALSMLL